MVKATMNIDLNTISSHSDLIKHLVPNNNFAVNDHVSLRINLNTFGLLLPDYLLLIACYVKCLQEDGVYTIIEFIDFKESSERTIYASRINFFKTIGFVFNEKFHRLNPIGRFTEINSFNKDNALELFKSIMSILIKNDIKEDMLMALDFCLWEIIDNTLNHSDASWNYDGKGYVCAQFYPYKKEIRIIIADSGIGIHKALTTHPETKFPDLDEKEAVLFCINNGVTNGVGMGFGLWATAELIKENRGQLIIHSGNYQLNTNENEIVQHSPYWQGTYTFLKIYTSNKIDCSTVFNDIMERRNLLNDLKDELNQEINDDLVGLW